MGTKVGWRTAGTESVRSHRTLRRTAGTVTPLPPQAPRQVAESTQTTASPPAGSGHCPHPQRRAADLLLPSMPQAAWGHPCRLRGLGHSSRANEGAGVEGLVKHLEALRGRPQHTGETARPASRTRRSISGTALRGEPQSRQTQSTTTRAATAPRDRRGPLDTPPPRARPHGYLGRVCDVVPVGGWELQLPGQDLVKEILLEVVLTEAVTEKQKSQRHHSALQ